MHHLRNHGSIGMCNATWLHLHTTHIPTSLSCVMDDVSWMTSHTVVATLQTSSEAQEADQLRAILTLIWDVEHTPKTNGQGRCAVATKCAR